MKTYELLEHTADIGVKVYGQNLEALFINAAHAMFEIMIEQKKKFPFLQRQEYQKFVVNKQADNIEELLVAWLGELLYLFATESVIMQKAVFEYLDARCIQSEIHCRLFAEEIDTIKKEIKAITYHELEVKQVRQGYEARVIFDV